MYDSPRNAWPDMTETLIDTPTKPAVIIVGGPSGIGKSTVAHMLQKSLNQRYHMSTEFGIPFVEGDDFHPKVVSKDMIMIEKKEIIIDLLFFY